MDYTEFEGPDGIRLRVPANDDYRTCAQCGADCEPDPTIGADGIGTRIAFVCPEHGLYGVVDPFEHLR